MNIAVALAAAAGAVLVVVMVARLVKMLRAERAGQTPQDRSPLWLLVAAGIGAYLFAYFAFGEDLLAPWRLALFVLVAASVPAVRRFLP